MTEPTPLIVSLDGLGLVLLMQVYDMAEGPGRVVGMYVALVKELVTLKAVDM